MTESRADTVMIEFRMPRTVKLNGKAREMREYNYRPADVVVSLKRIIMRQEVEIHCRHLGSSSFPSVEYVDADVQEEADAIHCAHGNVQELYAK
jgi:hypothetical protein